MNKVEPRPLHQEVASRIREMMRTGVLKTGNRIVETELCERLGVSRTPLREALRGLSSEGLIRLVPNRGAYVSQPSDTDIRDMFEVMSVLEGACARMAAEKMSEEGLARLEALHGRLEADFARSDREAYIADNNVFHALVQELAGNKTLNDIVTGLREKLTLYRYRQIFENRRFEESIAEHRGILDAFRTRDPAAAEDRMKEHLLRQGNALMAWHARKG